MRCRIDSSLLGLCKAKRARPPEEDLEEKRMDVGNDKSSPLQPHRCCQTARYILNFLKHSVRNAARIFNAFLRAPQPDVQSLAFCKVYLKSLSHRPHVPFHCQQTPRNPRNPEAVLSVGRFSNILRFDSQEYTCPRDYMFPFPPVQNTG